jgi:hypothetical protein
MVPFNQYSSGNQISGADKKPSVAELISKRNSVVEESIEDDITIIEDIQEAKNVFKLCPKSKSA